MAMLGSKIQTFHISIGGSHQMISSDVIDLMGQQIDLIYLCQFSHLGDFQTLVKVHSSFIGSWNITSLR